MQTYLILSHQSAQATADLFRYIYRKSNLYIFHVDRKAPSSLHDLAAKLSATFENVRVIESVYCSWGGFSLVAVTLMAMREALKTSSDWSHFIMLSEGHLPLVSADEVACSLVPNVSDIEMTSMLSLKGAEREDVANRFDFVYRELPGIGSFATGRRATPMPTDIFVGSQWMVLAKPLCEILVATSARDLWQFFSTSLLADETALQTIAGNLENSDLIIKNVNRTWVCTSERTGNSNMVFSEDNFFQAKDEGGFFFIRKRPDQVPKRISDLLESFSEISIEELGKLLPNQAGTRSVSRFPIAAKELVLHLNWQLAFLDKNLQIIVREPPIFGARCHIEFVHPKCSPQIALFLISEDMTNFKIVLHIRSPLQTSFFPMESHGLRTEVMRVRLYGLAYQREVYLDGDPDYGFLTLHHISDLNLFVDKLRRYGLLPVLKTLR